MDFQRFGIDPRLAKAAEGLPTSFFYYEKMLAHAVEMQENVCVKIALDAGREDVLLMPALQWLLSGEGRRLLVVVPDSESAGRCAAAVDRLGSTAGLGVRCVSRDYNGPGGDGTVGTPTFRLEGDPSSPVLIGMVEDLLGAPFLNLRDYGFLVVDGMDRLAELPSDLVRRFCGCLLPSWERRSALACSKFSIKVKNLAWDLADNPSEISIEGEVAKAQSVLKETWKVPVEAKFKFLLGLIEREKSARLCVFCNLKDTAREVTRRLGANGIATDTISGPLSPERKFALIEKFRAGDSTCLVLSDEGADGLTPGVFPLVVNYDIPLEPELFVKRLEMLDRSDPRAKVVSLACDRYIYGLPAVEQYIDAKLDATPADGSMLSAVDASEGSAGEKRQGADAYQRDARRVQPQRRDANRREDSRREEPRRDAHSRGGPDIRKSISEATGGALDMSGALPPDSSRDRLESNRRPPNGPPAKGEPRRGQLPSGGRHPGISDRKREDSRREDGRRMGGGKAPSLRGSPSRQAATRPSAAKPSPPGLPGNPYDMPMEERMRLYREKYGRGFGEDEARNGQRGPRPAGRPPVRRNPAQGGKEKRPGTIGGLPEAAREPEMPLPDPKRKPEGFVSRILGGLRKKKD
jgi:ATP-dependent RNA helicase RhlB